MDYYSSSYYDSNFGEYYYQSPDDSYKHAFFSSEALESNSFEYDSTPYYGAYDPEISHSSTVSYSSYTYSEPNYVEYGLNPYGEDYYSTVKTRCIISYSVTDDQFQFNMPEFEEYDPTPYGGGYDLDATYGKSLPPDEKICYPRSSFDPNDQILNNFSFGSIESPYGKGGEAEPVKKPRNGSKRVTFKDQEQQESKGTGKDDNKGSNGKPVDLNHGQDAKEDYPADHSFHGNGAIADNGTEYEKRGTQIPPGYGLEAMDLCESLFGYWPCLAKAKRENDYRNCHASHGVCSKWSNENCLWEGTANYLFGSSYPYGERWSYGGIYENPLFNYEKHYQEQPLSGQVEYHEEYSWLNMN